MAIDSAGSAGIAPEERRLVGLRETGAMLGLSRSSAYNLVQSGELEAVRSGRRLLVVVESIDAYVERLRSRNNQVTA